MTKGIVMPDQTRLKFPNVSWESRDQFRSHFNKWVRFYRRIDPRLSAIALLRKAYRQARTGYDPNPTH